MGGALKRTDWSHGYQYGGKDQSTQERDVDIIKKEKDGN